VDDVLVIEERARTNPEHEQVKIYLHDIAMPFLGIMMELFLCR